MRWLSSSARRVILLATFPALLSVHLWTDQNLLRAQEDEPWKPAVESIYLPPVQVLRTLALGRPAFVADVVWLRAIAYFGAEFVGDKDFRWLDSYIDTVLELDPEFRKAYHWAAVVVMYGARIDNSSVRASNRLLRKAIERFPEDWEFNFMLGANLYFELQTEDEEQRAKWRHEGAERIQRAANLPGGPAWLPLLAASIHTRLGQRDFAIRHLEEQYLRAEDEDLKQNIAERLAELRADHDVEALAEARAEFEARWQGSYPYLPPDLFLLVGDRMTASLDRLWELDEP